MTAPAALLIVVCSPIGRASRQHRLSIGRVRHWPEDETQRAGKSSTRRFSTRAERRDGVPQGLRAAADRAALGRDLGGAGTVPGRCARIGRNVLHCDPTAERNRIHTHRAHAGAHADRRADTLAPHARRAHTVAAGDGSCRNLDAGGGGARTGQAGADAQSAGAGRVRAAGVGMEGAQRRHDQKTDDPAGRFVRLVAGKVHARSIAVSGGSGSISAALPRRADLPGPVHRELVSTLPNGAERSGDGARGAQRAPVAHSLSGGGFERVASGGDNAAGDDARGHVCRGASGRRALPASGGQEGFAAADEPRNSHHRRRLCGSRIRHRGGESNSGARS